MTGPARREYAGAVSRILAFGVDAALVAAAAVAAVVVIVLIGSVIGTTAGKLARAVAPIFIIALPVLLAGYNAVFWGLAGRTPGMALLGIRVVTTRGRPVAWLSSLIRAVVLALFPIGFLWSLVDRRHQAIHDKLGRTTVVRLGPPARQGATGRNGPNSSAPF